MLTKESEFTPGISESGILLRLHRFVHESSVYRERPSAQSDDESFFEKAAVDPKYMMAMVNFIEDEFGVLVSNGEVTEENLGSLRAVARFVAARQPFAVG
ncbi:MAG TPA: hypothetical protein VJ840_05590 [Gemmatimonadaceae bacterium]|nr:hypothetical protein [Gemmatimonadaceae bacterium]